MATGREKENDNTTFLKYVIPKIPLQVQIPTSDTEKPLINICRKSGSS